METTVTLGEDVGISSDTITLFPTLVPDRLIQEHGNYTDKV